MKKYFVYVDDGKGCYRAAIPANSEKEAREYVAGNGEIIAVHNVTNAYPITAASVRDALDAAGFDNDRISFIMRALEATDIIEYVW